MWALRPLASAWPRGRKFGLSLCLVTLASTASPSGLDLEVKILAYRLGPGAKMLPSTSLP